MNYFADPDPGEVRAYIDYHGFNYRVEQSELHLETCPFCGKKKFCINEVTGKFRCFSLNSCGAKGNLISLKKHLGDIADQPLISKDNFYQGKRFSKKDKYFTLLADQRRWALSHQNILRDSIGFWQGQLNVSSAAMNEWQERQILPSTLNQFKVGYCPKEGGLCLFLKQMGHSDSIILSSGMGLKVENDIIDHYRDVFALPVMSCGVVLTIRFKIPGWRRDHVDGKGFVLKPGDGSSQGSHIINGDVLLKNPRYVIIAEGEPDLYTLAQAGFNSVGVPGAGIFKEQWKEHFKMISTIYVALDPDKAGEVGFESILKKLCRPLHRVNMPGCDINSLLQRSGSAEAFSKFFNILLTESEYCEVPL